MNLRCLENEESPIICSYYLFLSSNEMIVGGI